jgi:hypothetical protein
MPRKNLFQDYHDEPKKTKVPEPKVVSETKDYVEMLVTDGRTGAQYKVKEKKPHGPQGNFSIPSNQAENRYRMIMGLPAATPFHSERPDDPFAEDRVLPEAMMNRADVEEKVRERIMSDTRRQQFLMPSRETMHFETEEAPERPSHTLGYFGTEKEVHPMPSKMTRESHQSKQGPLGAFSGPQQNYIRDDPIEKRVGESKGLQVLLTAAYRGLFGSMVADHIMTRSSLADRRPGFEMPVVSHMIQDHGLMKPWTPPELMSDRPSKPEAVEYAVGLRAIDAIPKGSIAPDLEDLPKAEREALITAVGRTVLHALTSVPQQITDDKPDIESTLLSQRRDEIKKAIAGSLKPDLLRGIVPQEYIITDRAIKENQLVQRVGGSSRAYVGPQRQASTNLEEQNIRPVVTRPTLGDFSSFSTSVRKKKILFEEDEKEGPYIPSIPEQSRIGQVRGRTSYSKNTMDSIHDREPELGLVVRQ